MSSSSSSCDFSSVVYNKQHLIDVFHQHRPHTQRNVSILITTLPSSTKVKLRDQSEYSFNYTSIIDWSLFEQIRKEQSLDINYDEFQPQIVDLLNQTALKQMQIRLDATDTKCKLIFYEKSRLKSLIFLTLDFELTNQREVIEELSDNMNQLQNFNKSLTTQLTATKSQLFENELVLKTTVSNSSLVEKQFYKDLELILQTFLSRIESTQVGIETELEKVTKRHRKLLTNLDAVRKDTCLKNESSARLLQTMQNLRIENQKQQRMITELKTELDLIKSGNNHLEQSYTVLKTDLVSKTVTLETVQKQLDELKRDMQDATLIIAQKTKSNEEMAKDLMEANRLLVNFNSQYELLTNEVEDLKERISCKDEVIKGQALELDKLRRDYQSLCDQDEVNNLNVELRSSKQRIDELEKQYKDAVKLNGLLTKKLSSGDHYDVRNVNLPFPNKS